MGEESTKENLILKRGENYGEWKEKMGKGDLNFTSWVGLR